LGERDRRIVAKISKKLGWGLPGLSWLPGVDDLDA
jgi:peptide deformylase